MATTSDEKLYEISNLSGAVQRKATQFMSSKDQVDLAINASFKRIGGVEKIKGWSRVGNTITTTTSSTTSSSSTTTSSSSTTSTSSSTSSTSTSTSTSSSTSSSTSTSSTTTGA